MKLNDYLQENAWVWAGTALVLLTLSGSTLRQALWITFIAVAVHGVATFISHRD